MLSATSSIRSGLSIPSPDSTRGSVTVTVVLDYRSFQFLHRIPRCSERARQGPPVVLLSIPSPDSTEKGKVASHCRAMTSFQFLHRIPHSTRHTVGMRNVFMCLPFNSFTGFHLISLRASLRTILSFNSFTGFHCESCRPGLKWR